ncbi:MAG: bacteriohemerythrin [Leptospiraceae bacterium]|nr:hemerythrin family protein [Leptospiraceae bacterium]MCK6381156.1 bacteriohemerythrin [Leptospiraceae bacterium]NUM42498.1 hemerythrin family protein [Leptospiraceae bacterium]
MALFNWSQKYNIGIKSIDDQHVKLFAIINSLHNAIVHQNSSMSVVQELLEELLSYAKSHFRYEESLMEGNGYLELEKHIIEHEKLINDLDKYKNRFDSGELKDLNELLTFSINWLQNHILVSDMQYSGFLIKQGVK